MEWNSFSAPARMTIGSPSARTIAGAAKSPTPTPAMNSRRRIPDVIDETPLLRQEMQQTCRWRGVRGAKPVAVVLRLGPLDDVPASAIAGMQFAAPGCL